MKAAHCERVRDPRLPFNVCREKLEMLEPQSRELLMRSDGKSETQARKKLGIGIMGVNGI